MKKITISNLNPRVTVRVLSMLLTLAGCTQEVFSPNLTESFTLTSAEGAVYEIKVALPQNYNTSTSYGTIYVLDGEENFDLVASHCREISYCLGVTNVLVVSIGYGNDRELDYTPTSTSPSTGGAPLFMEFIRHQLIPRMEQDYNADTARLGRIILGHSYGGLFGVYAFGSHNEVFGNYILLSPSIWFDNEVTLQYEEDNRVTSQTRRQLVFMGIGEMENSGRMQAPFEAFFQILTKNYPDLSLARNREEDLDHVGSKNPNIKLGLNYYFENRSR